MASDRERTWRVSDRELQYQSTVSVDFEQAGAMHQHDRYVLDLRDTRADLVQSEKHRAELDAELTRVRAERDEALEQVKDYGGECRQEVYEQGWRAAATSLEAQLAEQAKAGRSLANNVAGIWALYESGLRDVMGNTNYRVVEDCLAALDAKGEGR